MRERLVSVLLSPVSIALILTIVVSIFLPTDLFQKFKVEMVDYEVLTSYEKPITVNYSDLDNDGNSDKIMLYHNIKGEVAVSVRPEDGSIVNQWNVEGKLLYFGNGITFGDLNNDDTLEVVFTTLFNNAIYLNILQPYHYGGLIKKVELFRSDNYTLDSKDIIQGFESFFIDLNQDGNSEIIITVNGGYLSIPRNVFAYDFKNDKVISSPYLCNKLNLQQFEDLNGDGNFEILLRGHSSDNKVDTSKYHCSDESSYLVVLNSSLEYYIDPIEFNCIYSIVQPYVINDKRKMIVVLKTSRNKSECYPELILFSNSGDLMNQRILKYGKYSFLAPKNFNYNWLYNNGNGEVLKVRSDLSLNHQTVIETKLTIKAIDYQSQDKASPYWIGLSNNHDYLILYQEEFDHAIKLRVSNPENVNLHYGVKPEKDQPFQLYVQAGDEVYIYEYFLNPLYPFRFLTYPGIFIFFLGIVFLGNRGQKIRERKKREIEQEIAELQLKSIKNQVDPHFVFNSINTISAMMLEEDKESADRFITKFAKLMRQTLRGSDKISARLMDELEYIENYIQLQQIRYEHRFEFTINIDPDVDLYRKIPKHVLFTYVENAIKHGLAHKEDKGFLSVDVLQTDGRLRLVVEDNGIGEKAKLIDNPYSSGRGMKIMEQIFSLYQRIHKTRIKYQAIPLKDSDGEPSGMRVQIDFEK